MPGAFTLRVFVLDGDPEGVRFIDRMNWTGLGIVFPRSKWPEIKSREEFGRTGIYVLTGYSEGDDDLLTVYIGQADGVKGRIDAHAQNKDFWDTGIVFVSNSGGGLNRAHVTWLEHALVAKAHEMKRCRVDNSNEPQEPALSEAEKADTVAFLHEILQILPLVGLRVFDAPRVVAIPTTSPNLINKQKSRLNTVVVPAQQEGFESVFLGQDCWYAIRISGGMIDKIEYIAAYQTNPISAVTHYAPVSYIEPYGDSGKYKLVFSEKATAINHIKFGDAPKGTMQGPRYTTVDRLKNARTLSELFK
ncbi:MAG: GIY-YIG nuclease family protein [Gemmatimonadota bacterium]|nr:GIY-YIG nuclease family protein [Gemmatimonadota bacterium]